MEIVSFYDKHHAGNADMVFVIKRGAPEQALPQGAYTPLLSLDSFLDRDWSVTFS